MTTLGPSLLSPAGQAPLNQVRGTARPPEPPHASFAVPRSGPEPHQLSDRLQLVTVTAPH